MRDNINMTLAPYLSLKNFEVSVAARLNADKIQTNETVYNPDQKAERSVRTVKEKPIRRTTPGHADRRRADQPAQDQQCLDRHQTIQRHSDKKEELTNLRDLLASQVDDHERRLCHQAASRSRC